MNRAPEDIKTKTAKESSQGSLALCAELSKELAISSTDRKQWMDTFKETHRVYLTIAPGVPHCAGPAAQPKICCGSILRAFMRWHFCSMWLRISRVGSWWG